MSRHKITAGSSSQAVPFSWEQLPGISKVTHHVPMDHEKPKQNSVQHHHRGSKLCPPPPSSSCRFVPSHHRTRGRKGVVSRPELEDPFLAAFIECTKSVDEKDRPAERKAARVNSWPRSIERLRITAFGLSMSCKSSCGVREGNLVKLPKLPEREADFDW